MELARRAGLDVAPVRFVESMGRGVLLVERFDRSPTGARRRVVSAATILSMQTIVAAQHFSYVELADEIRANFVEPDPTLRELFSRIMFNILVGNTDDLTSKEGREIGEQQVDTIRREWDEVCDAAHLTTANERASCKDRS